MTEMQEEAIRRFSVPHRAYVEMIQVLQRTSASMTADDVMWELLRWLAKGGHEIRKIDSRVDNADPSL